MSEDEAQRGIAKRQIARLIGGAAFPAYVLSEDLQIVFANEALGRLLGCDPDALIGLECPRRIDGGKAQPASPGTETESAGGQPKDRALAAWLSPFPNSDPKLASLHRDCLPTFLPATPGRLESNSLSCEPIEEGSEATSTPWLRVSMPLELGESPLTLVFLKPDRGDLEAIPVGETASRIKAIALRWGLEFPSMGELWFVHGPSPAASVIRNQLAVAGAGQHSLLIEGVAGSPTLLLAHAIHRARKTSLSTTPFVTSQPITIECRLMDRDLLQSVFDWIDDESRQGGPPTIVLHEIELLSPELRQPLARKQQLGRWCVLGTTSLSSSLQSLANQGNSPAWAQLLALLQTQTLRLSPLSERVGDMESLVSAWLDQSEVQRSGLQHATWSREFMDAIQAYSWPGDCEEFQQALEHAVRSAASEKLSESHLPISIRTFPSHNAHRAAMDPIVLDDVLENIERELIARAVQRFPRNRTAAAKLLGISRARLLRRLQQTGLGQAVSKTPRDEDAVGDEGVLGEEGVLIDEDVMIDDDAVVFEELEDLSDD